MLLLLLNTVAVRASYIFYLFWSDFLGENQVKPLGEGVVYLPPGNKQNRNLFASLSFGVTSINWQSLTEIGEITCSTTQISQLSIEFRSQPWEMPVLKPHGLK